MKVAVIGSSGRMGSFFVRYFLSRRLEVTGSDVRKGKRIKSPRFTYFRSNREAVRGAQFVFLATPIDDTIRAAEEVAPAMAPGSTLVEICSVKGKIRPQLKRVLAASRRARKNRLLSIHPLFGPSIESFTGMRVAVVTRRNKGSSEEMKTARRLLPGATLVALEEDEHDRMMALSLSLTHVLNLAYAKTLAAHISAVNFRKLSTPNSLVQLNLAEGVLSQSPSLYSYIQMENKHSRSIVESLADEINELKEIVRKKDRRGFEEVFKKMSRIYRQDTAAHPVLQTIYRTSQLVQDE